MLFVVIIIIFTLIFSLRDVSAEQHHQSKEEFERITGHKYK